jgi:uncharacterized protein (DUF2267 family)
MGRSCGRFVCHKEEIDLIRDRTGWFDGTVITVVAEYHRQQFGDNAQAAHATSLVLYALRSVIDHPNDTENVERQLNFVQRQINLVFAHVYQPKTLEANFFFRCQRTHVVSG